MTWMVAVAAIAFSSVGCVSQREADEALTLYRRSQEQIIELQSQLEQAEAQIAALRAAAEEDENVRQQLQQLRAERERLAEALALAERQLQEAAVGTELPAELSAQLAQLAQAYPEMLSYDPELGMVKFASDFTFALGSAELRTQAEQTLQRLAQILQGEAAQGYEVRIVGHTDNVPIKNPATRAKHPTNWHLSVHRAIAVEEALEQAGVTPRRMNVSGYGPYRPVVPNARGGAQANRRVEIYLVSQTTPQFDASPQAEQIVPGGPSVVEEQPAPAAEESPAMFK